ncbi:MAG: phosphoribosylamine--glycine ligase [Phycisphaerales bacterium]|nr:phosphoribosylamine--glycine ligase [Phycisphaerales bacterium]
MSIPCPNPCNVLLVGGGGREHALAWKLSQSPRLGKLYATDCSNGGIASLALPCDETWNTDRIFFLNRWCDKHDIHLVVVGPEVPLAEGIANELSTETRYVFGPKKEAARIEADKAYAKELMHQASIPTADARSFTEANSARQYVLRGLDREFADDGNTNLATEVERLIERLSDPQGWTFKISDELYEIVKKRVDPCVVKASGLAAGKGVIVCKTVLESLEAIQQIMDERSFGEAGGTILIEEFMEGQEVSVLALVDGRTIWVLDLCQDHKQVGEGDVGANTGGMGAYSPAPLLDDDTMEYVEREILVPAVDGMRRDGIEFRGVLYAGLMLTNAGPKVLEFNCRFGDPETQPLMARLQGDLVDILWRTATGQLEGAEISFDENVACCVVMCSAGYPGTYKKGLPISGIENAEVSNDVVVFHAGTDATGNELTTSGGRVLGVTAIAKDLVTARDQANDACSEIAFDGAFWRHDIGCRVLHDNVVDAT